MPHLGRPRNLLLLGGSIGATYYFYLKYGFRTPGVKAIEDRYTSGGGTDTHLPAVATKRGDPNNVDTSRQQNAKGVNSKFFKEHVSDQKTEVC